MKILAVDDEPLFLELLGQILSQLNFTDVHFASSGQEALDMVARETRPFDCFLLDIRMDNMDGIELCRRIRGLTKHRHTPIVMVTAMSEKQYVDAAFLTGANDYVTKPIDRIEIKVRMNMVQTILNERTHSGRMAKEIAKVEKTLGERCQFDDEVVLNDAHGLVPFASLENYLLKLGNMRLLSSAAVGFHIENALDIFGRAVGLEFVDMLSDTASVIANALKSQNHMLSYSGSGDFVAVIPRASSFDRAEVEMNIEAGVAAFSDIYLADGLVPPRLRVGTPKTNGLLSFGSPTRMLDAAMKSARIGTPAGSLRRSRFAEAGA